MNNLFQEGFEISEETLPIISNFAEFVPGGFFIYHADGDEELIYFNSHTPALFGCANKEEFIELTGNSFKGIVHPDDIDRVNNELVSQLGENKSNLDHIEYRIVRKDGTIAVLDDYGQLMHTKSFGDIFFVFVQDITEKHNFNMLNNIMSTLSETYDEVFRLDYEMTRVKLIYSTNSSKLDYLRLYKGVDFDTYLNEYIENYVYDDDKDMFINSINKKSFHNSLAQGKPYIFKFRVKTGNGAKIYELKAVKDKTDTNEASIMIGVRRILDIEAQRIAIAECNNVFSNEKYDSKSINQMLSIIAKFYNADRAFIFELSDEKEYMKNTYEYCKSGVVSELSERQELPKSIILKQLNLAIESNSLHIELSDSTSILGESLKEAFDRFNVTGISIAPIINFGDIIGFIGVDNPKTEINNLRVLENAAGLVGGVIIRVNQDTEARIKEREALLKAEAANKAKTDFLFNMSHDIRTPMNAIIGFINMAKKHIEDRAKVIDSLNKTEEASKLLLSLINDILDMSRIESGKIQLEEINADMEKAFVEIEPTMHALAKTKNIDISFEILNIKDRYVYVDISHTVRVLVNIVTNAIKYTNNGGWVKAKCEQVGRDGEYGLYRFTFQDNGIGMSEEFQKRAFDEFAREESATNSGIQGTGLGLAVCRSFVRAMNGKIELESKQGCGSTFIVTFPFRINKTPNVIIDMETDIDISNFAGKKVLLVDDNDLNREITVDLLNDFGMEVETASDGMIAVETIKAKGPSYFDIIFMDIQMPIMNGYDATREIRRLYPNDDIKIIALSANAFEEDKVRSINAGMNDHIAKPIDIFELKRTINKYL